VQAFPSLGYAIPPTTPIEVIPTCADLARFAPGPPDHTVVDRLSLNGSLVIGCVGTLSNWYLRTETLGYLALLAERLERAKILFVTREDHEALRRDARAAGVAPERLIVIRAEFAEMPAYLRLMDLGVFFIKPGFSKQGSAATKLAEFLACGVPVVVSRGIGDTEALVRDERVGVVVEDLAGPAYERAAAALEALRAEGGLAERWLFFVEGTHVQNLYYGLYPVSGAPNPLLTANKAHAPLPPK